MSKFAGATKKANQIKQSTADPSEAAEEFSELSKAVLESRPLKKELVPGEEHATQRRRQHLFLSEPNVDESLKMDLEFDLSQKVSPVFVETLEKESAELIPSHLRELYGAVPINQLAPRQFGHVLEECKDSGDLNLAMSLYRRVCRLNQLRQAALVLLAQTESTESKTHKFQPLKFTETKAYAHEANHWTYVSLLGVCAAAKDVGTAFQIVETEMPKHGVPLDSTVLTTLMSVCANAKDLDAADRVDKMRRDAKIPTTTVYLNSCLDLFAKSGSLNRAESLFRRMKALASGRSIPHPAASARKVERTVPSVVGMPTPAFERLLSFVESNGTEPSSAAADQSTSSDSIISNFLNQMRGEPTSSPHETASTTTATTPTDPTPFHQPITDPLQTEESSEKEEAKSEHSPVILAGLSDPNAPSDTVREADIELDLVSYNSIILACVNASEGAKAISYYEEMLKAGIEPSMMTYSFIMRAYTLINKFSHANQLYDYVKGNLSLTPTSFFYCTYISALAAAAKADECLKVFEEMRTHGQWQLHTQQPLSDIVLGFCNSKRPHEALRFIDRYFSILQEEKQKQDQASSGTTLFGQQRRDILQRPSAISFVHILVAFGRHAMNTMRNPNGPDHAKIVEQLASNIKTTLSAMERYRVPLSTPHYGALLHAYHSTRQNAMVWQTYDEMQKKSMLLNTYCCNVLLRAAGWARDFAKARAIFDPMILALNHHMNDTNKRSTPTDPAELLTPATIIPDHLTYFYFVSVACEAALHPTAQAEPATTAAADAAPTSTSSELEPSNSVDLEIEDLPEYGEVEEEEEDASPEESQPQAPQRKKRSKISQPLKRIVADDGSQFVWGRYKRIPAEPMEAALHVLTFMQKHKIAHAAVLHLIMDTLIRVGRLDDALAIFLECKRKSRRMDSRLVDNMAAQRDLSEKLRQHQSFSVPHELNPILLAETCNALLRVLATRGDLQQSLPIYEYMKATTKRWNEHHSQSKAPSPPRSPTGPNSETFEILLNCSFANSREKLSAAQKSGGGVDETKEFAKSVVQMQQLAHLVRSEMQAYNMPPSQTITSLLRRVDELAPKLAAAHKSSSSS